MLADGLHDVPPGKLATVVTHLEMRAMPALRDAPAPDGWTLRRVAVPEVNWYRALFRSVGQDWLWWSRLQLDQAALRAIICDPMVTIWTLSRDGRDAALLELDFRTEGECELAFFGLTEKLIGTGAGKFLMNKAVQEAWAKPISRFWVHTCTLDSPRALGFYRRSGFVPYRQQIEIADDPRLSGDLPCTAGAHVPIFD